MLTAVAMFLVVYWAYKFGHVHGQIEALEWAIEGLEPLTEEPTDE